jgi:hypothetical protein
MQGLGESEAAANYFNGLEEDVNQIACIMRYIEAGVT